MNTSEPAKLHASLPMANVLLVDDRPENLLVLEAVLAELGVNLVKAGSAAEALEHLAHTEFALVLLDVQMQPVGGLEAAQIIRSRDKTRATPIIFLTAYEAGNALMQTAYALGAVDFLSKPIVPVILQAKVAGFVRLFQEKELARHQAEQYRLLIEGTTGYAIFMLDPAGYVASWNPGAERIKGYRAEEIIGQHFSRFYPQEAIDRDFPAHELRVAEAHGRFEDEGWRVRKDGTQFWASVMITALRDEQGGLRGFSKVTRDLTERKLAEAALRQSEERFRLIIEGVKDYAIFLLSPQGYVASWNPGAERIKGYRAEEIIGQHFSRFYPQEAIDRGWPAHELRVAEAEGRFEDEGWRVRKDGTTFWANVVITAMRDETGKLRGFSKITRDMTERKRAEENAQRLVAESTARRMAEENARLVQAERERLHVTLASIADAVVSTDAEGRVVFLNPVAENLLGWTSEEAEQRPVTEVFQIVHEATRQPVSNPALEALREGRPVELANHTILISRKGMERPIDDSASPIRDADGAIIGSVLVFRDISRLKKAFDALREADRRKDEFLATLAHELRNPLAPIRNSLQILKMPRVDAELARQSREIMERQVCHLVRLVDDLLDVSRVMRGKIELRRERMELATAVARALEIAQPLIEVQAHRLEVSLPEESLLLDADPVRLAQVIGNLLTNAAKYTDPGGDIWVAAQREGDEAVLRVRDNGIGIALDTLPHVFELFVQADHSLTKTHGGLGIGLTLVKNLVEMHGGSVSAGSAGLGRGAEFVMRLPLVVEARPDGLVSGRAAHAAPPPDSGHRLLVVDDNRDAAASLAMLLELKGHHAKMAHDGVAALELAASYRPDLVFLDLGMPGMDGYEVARRIRTTSGLENTILVALTGWGQQEDRRRTAEAGFNYHLVKPPEVKEVESILASLNARA